MPPPNLDLVAEQVCATLSATYVRPLGMGAFKSAYLIERGTGHFALKIAAVAPGNQARFQRECDAQRDCTHTSIAVLYDAFAFSSDSVAFWVWIEEFLPCGTLQERRGNSLLSVSTVRSMGSALIGALAHLRSRNLVHRDIKPANIIFRTDADPVLTDFGIVRALDLPTLTHHFLPQGPGTPAYAAPEQLNNDLALIDWRTDQFGLALVLGESLLGYHPFSPEGDVHQAISRVATRSPLPETTAQTLKALGFESMTRALAAWPVGRFRTPQQFLDAVAGGDHS